MSRNGSGTYIAPAASFPAVANTLIESAKYNNVINDIASEITKSIANDGQTPILANLPMSGFKHTGAAAASAGGEYAEYTQMNTAIAAAIAPLATSAALTALSSAALQHIKAGTSSRSMTAASGVQTITGVGFQPRMLIIFASVANTTMMSIGMTDGTTEQCVRFSSTSLFSITSHSINLQETVSNGQLGFVTFTADGFDIAWTKGGTPAANTANLFYVAIG